MTTSLIDLLPFVSRLFTLFFLSPLFARKRIPFLFKLTLVLITLLFSLFITPKATSNAPLFILIIKESLMGFLLGFVIAILFEASLLAGEMMATLFGLSYREILTPHSLLSPIGFSQLTLLLVIALCLNLDLHHTYLKIIFFKDLSLQNTEIITITSYIFSYAFLFFLIPFLLHTFLILLFAMATALIPEIPLFWLAPPLQTLLGLAIIILNLNHFPNITSELFHQIIKTLGG